VTTISSTAAAPAGGSAGALWAKARPGTAAASAIAETPVANLFMFIFHPDFILFF
jgi:hypothetical protein